MKKVISVLLLSLMILIFCFSAQPAVESTLTSSRFCTIAAKILYRNYSAYDDEIQRIITGGLSYIIRKAAHFTEYALMGFLWYLLLRKKRYNLFFSVSATALYAASDELHQRFVLGRSGQIQDVILDTCGGCAGVLLAFLVLCIWNCCTNKQIIEHGIWKN